MNEEKIEATYYKDLSDQIRSALSEFYQVNSVFVLADTFFITFEQNPNKINIIIFIIINLIWLKTIDLTNEWITFYIEKARKLSEGETPRITKENNLWYEKTETRKGLRNWFYFIPILFIILLASRL